MIANVTLKYVFTIDQHNYYIVIIVDDLRFVPLNEETETSETRLKFSNMKTVFPEWSVITDKVIYKVFHEDLTYIPCGHMAICQNFVKHLVLWFISDKNISTRVCVCRVLTCR